MAEIQIKNIRIFVKQMYHTIISTWQTTVRIKQLVVLPYTTFKTVGFNKQETTIWASFRISNSTFLASTSILRWWAIMETIRWIQEVINILLVNCFRICKINWIIQKCQCFQCLLDKDQFRLNNSIRATTDRHWAICLSSIRLRWYRFHKIFNLTIYSVKVTAVDSAKYWVVLTNNELT